MKCFFYKWISKKTGKVVMANLGWADSFETIKSKDESRTISVQEITEKEFRQLRARGY